MHEIIKKTYLSSASLCYFHNISKQIHRGAVGGVVLYGRALSQMEMERMALACLCPIDYMLYWVLEDSEIHGDVTYQLSSICQNKLIESIF